MFRRPGPAPRTKRRNSSDLLQRYFFAAPRDVFEPARVPVATDVNTASPAGRRIRLPESVTTVDAKEAIEMMAGDREVCVPTFSPNVKKSAMFCREAECGAFPVIDLDLFPPGIAFDVENPFALQQVVIQLLGAAHIEMRRPRDRVRRGASSANRGTPRWKVTRPQTATVPRTRILRRPGERARPHNQIVCNLAS